MSMPDPYASFLVRLWREAGVAAGWQGEVEHIQSGRRWAFDSLDETLDFLRRAIDLHDGPSTGPDDVLRSFAQRQDPASCYHGRSKE